MSKKMLSMPRGGRRAAAVVVAIQMLASLPAVAASPAPLKVVDRDPRANWIEAHSWGGGVRFVFELEQSSAAGSPASSFLAGGAPEFTLGCANPDPAKSYWRFRVGSTPPGSGITSRDEIAHEKGMAHYFGAPGTLVLFDEMDKEMKRFPLLPKNGALETERLEREDVQSFLNASAIRAETPRILFESGTVMLKGALDKMSKLPCAAR